MSSISRRCIIAIAHRHRSHRAVLILLLLACFCSVIPRAAVPSDELSIEYPKEGYIFYVVPHSHMDLEWMWTYEQGQAFAIRILRQALQTLKDDPRFAFTQDQMQALKPFWDSLSQEDRAVLRRLVHEGRFEVVTGMVNQPDVNEPDFESLTRQFLVAKPWMEETLDAKILTAWNVDTFGQTVQMPQLFHGAGLRYCFFSRDFPSAVENSARNLFYWRSPDGSQVLAHLASYATVNPNAPADMDMKFWGQYLKSLLSQNPSGNDSIMLPWGWDEYLPTQGSQEIETRVRQIAAHFKIPLKKVLISTPSQYFAAVEHSGVKLPTYSYDFNPPLVLVDLRGIWGQRPRLKLAERTSEDLLESSEKLASIASLSGYPYAATEVRWGWQRVLANQVHDTMGGSHSDIVDEVAMSRYAGAAEAARQVQSDALFNLSRKINTTASGEFPILVFNPQSFPHTGLVHYTQTFFQETNMTHKEVTNFVLRDPQGQTVPFRVLATSYKGLSDEPTRTDSGEEGAVAMAEIEFVATDVPPVGYRIYRIEPIGGTLQVPKWVPLAGEVSNRFFSLTIDPATGSIAKLTDLQSERTLLRQARYGGNELVLEEEQNPDMEGPTQFTGGEIRANASRPESISMRTDDLGTTVRIQGSFMGGVRIQEIALYDQMPRVDFKTLVKGFPGHDGMLTVVFPLPYRPGTKSLYETHNAVIERPDGLYWAHTWMDRADPQGGLAILNRGTGGYQVAGDVARLVLLRSVTQYRTYRVPAAAEAGDHEFEYSLYSHAGDWIVSGVIEQAHSFNSPLRVISTDAHSGTLPREHSFLFIRRGSFEATALKKAEQGEELILRGHETHGKSGRIRIDVALPLQRAWLSDLMEKPRREIPVSHHTIEFDVKPFEFVTLRLKMRGGIQ